MTRFRVIEMAAVLAAVILASPATGAVQVTSAVRKVLVDIDSTDALCLPNPPGYDCLDPQWSNQHDEDETTDLLPFDSTASSWGATASQQSTLGPVTFQGTASVSSTTAWSDYFVDGLPYLHMEYARGASVVVVSFDLDEPTPYALMGHVRQLGPFFGWASPARITLTGPMGVIAEATHWNYQCDPVSCQDEPPVPITTSGVLAAGSHTLEAELDATSGGYAAGIGTFGDGMQGDLDFQLTLGAAVPVLGSTAMRAVVLAMLVVGVRAARERRAADAGPGRYQGRVA